MNSQQLSQIISSRIDELSRLDTDRDRLAGEIEDLRTQKRGIEVREKFEREFQCLNEPLTLSLVG
ncbi:MAG: hypothetical protein QOH63_1937 [Acidobacteriota bacterium]|jgi:hypothetical protein|nr:hypothetical protein [Acidobacteriota bacterium]